jgi:hypothetical protein
MHYASPAVELADGIIPADSRLLFVGFAGVYYCEHPFSYNTVFDDSIFESLVHKPGARDESVTPGEASCTFHTEGIDFIVVDWNAIARYREPGNYGYTDFVTPDRFRTLVDSKVLRTVWRDPAAGPGRGVEVYRVLPKGQAK